MNRTKAVRKLLLSLSLAASAFAAPAYAQISVNINLAPPAPQYEVVPIIAPGNVWAPGYWGWTGERHVWVRGRTIVQREGYRWEPDRWDQRDSGYYRTAGHWEHDKGYKPRQGEKGKESARTCTMQRSGDDGKHGKGGKHDG